jgi:tight adherence protein B
VNVAITALAGAVLAWPAGVASLRLARLTGHGAFVALRRPRLTTGSLMLLAGVVGWCLAGVGGAVAAGILVATGWRSWRRHHARRQALRSAEGFAEALRSFAGELRAGSHPAVAAESTAKDANELAAAALRVIAATSRLGGDVAQALGRFGAELPDVDDALVELGRAWSLGQRHGLPLAEAIGAVADDLAHRARFTRQVEAKTAGARSSAAVLAALPLLGIALGEAIGARPWQVLSSAGLGQVLLVLGSVLVCAGVAWSARLTRQAVMR